MTAWLSYAIGLFSYAVLFGGMGYWTFRFLAPAFDPFVYERQDKGALNWLFVKIVAWFILLQLLGAVVGEWTLVR
jgi:hypothetical protein